jgi:hypothetical protein
MVFLFQYVPSLNVQCELKSVNCVGLGISAALAIVWVNDNHQIGVSIAEVEFILAMCTYVKLCWKYLQ